MLFCNNGLTGNHLHRTNCRLGIFRTDTKEVMMSYSDRRLYFLRHGLADRSAWNGADFERPLTPLGKQRMAREAMTMVRLQLQLDLIISSPLTRALQTATIVAEHLGLQDRLCQDDRVAFDLDAAVLSQLLSEHHQATSLMLVGHEPTFSLTVSEITGGSEVICKKGSLVRVDLSQDAPPRGELVWLIPPKVLAL
jgi:phosphohistidine phosphatase